MSFNGFSFQSFKLAIPLKCLQSCHTFNIYSKNKQYFKLTKKYKNKYEGHLDIRSQVCIMPLFYKILIICSLSQFIHSSIHLSLSIYLAT